MSNKKKWSDEQLTNAVKNNFSISGVLKTFGILPKGRHYINVKKHIKQLNLDTSHFTGRGHLKGKTHNWNIKIPLEQILIENSTYSSATDLKKRLIKDGIFKNECSICGQKPIWNGKPLNMILDHKNGINDDNRLENLRLICRHCDSQLPTYCGRNIKHVKKVEIYKEPKPKLRKVFNRPNKEELELLVKKNPFTSIGKMYGVSDNAVRKWCKYENVDFKNIRTKYKRENVLSN